MNSNRRLPCGCEGDPDGYQHADVSGVTRRTTLDMFAAGGLWASIGAAFAGYPSPARAGEDDVVRIGYLPITDATALLVAHAKGFFKEEGLEAQTAGADPRVVAPDRELRGREV